MLALNSPEIQLRLHQRQLCALRDICQILLCHQILLLSLFPSFSPVSTPTATSARCGIVPFLHIRAAVCQFVCRFQSQRHRLLRFFFARFQFLVEFISCRKANFITWLPLPPPSPPPATHTLPFHCFLVVFDSWKRFLCVAAAGGCFALQQNFL